MGGQSGNRLSLLVRGIDRRIDLFFAGRGRSRRARDAESVRLAGEFLKPRDGGGFEGWARMRSGVIDSVLAPLVLTHERLTFAPGDAHHQLSMALADIVSVDTESMGMTVRSRTGEHWRLFFYARTGFDRGNVSDGGPALVVAWREAILAAMTGREPAFAGEGGAYESDYVEAAFNRVFDARALDEAPVRVDFAYRALGYPVEWHLSPGQQQALRDVCRHLGERTIGRMEVEYGRARAEVFVDGDLYAERGSLSAEHVFVSMKGRWGLFVTHQWFAVLACESEDVLATFERAMPEFRQGAIPAELEGAPREWLTSMLRHTRMNA